MIATESYYANPANATTALNAITGIVANSSNQPYLYDPTGRKIRIAGDQFFSSQLVYFDPSNKRSQFEIKSGKSATGKNLKKAYAYYRMGNITFTNSGFPGKSALYLGGNLANGDNGMTVSGYATFEGKVKSQNGKPMIFNPKNNEGDVFFNDTANIINDSVEFNVKSYFNKDVIFGDNTKNRGVFKQDVGFNGDFIDTKEGRIFNFGGNVWINGNIKKSNSPDNTPNVNLTARSVPTDGNNNKKFNYTNTLVACSEKYCTITSSCSGSECRRCSVHGVILNQRIDIDDKVTNFSDATKSSSSLDILAANNLSMTDFLTRKNAEPNLNMSPVSQGGLIPDNVINSSASLFMTNNNQFSIATIEDKLKTAKSNELYNGHLVVRIDKSHDYPSNIGNQTFKGKVIFIVGNGVTFNLEENFYNSDPSASTLIYAEPGATLKLGFPNPDSNAEKLFRGLIFIDQNNTENHEFKWTPKTKIQGAVLMKGSGNLAWHSRGGNNSPTVTIERDDAVLESFGGLVAGGSSNTAILEPGKDAIELTPLGYYFY